MLTRSGKERGPGEPWKVDSCASARPQPGPERWENKADPGRPSTSILGGLQGSAADILVPDTTADLQGSSEVRSGLFGQSGGGSGVSVPCLV